MPPTSTIPESPPRPPRTPSPLPITIAAFVASVLLLVQVSTVLKLPDRIDQLTIHNETQYDLNIDLRSAPDASRLRLAPVSRGSSKTLPSVIDPGSTFVFEFSYGGVDTESITVSRAALEQNGWQVTIPAEIASPIRAAGLSPPPG